MTKVKIKDIYSFILEVLPVSPNGDLLVEVENGRLVVLASPKQKGIVAKTSGILKTKTPGIKLENDLRREEEKRLKREIKK